MRARDRTVLAILGGLFLLRCVATFRPSAWMWGLDSLADRSPALRAVGLALFALAILPPVAGRIAGWLLRLGETIPGRILFAGGSVVTLFLLWALRSNNLMLGDAQTYVSTIEKGMRAAGGAHREPLAQGIVAAFHAVLGGALGIGGQGSFTAVELILAVGALAIGAGIARRIASEPPVRILVFASILLGGVPQLYSGYPEFYGFAVGAILLFALAALRWIDEGGSLIPVSLAFVIAGLMHAQAIFAFPALVYLIAVGWKKGRKRDVAIASAVVPVAAFLGLALLRYPFGEIGHEAGRSDSFLPPVGGVMSRTAYGVFALAHGAELLNVTLLIAPTLPALVALAASDRRGPRASRDVFLSLLAIGPILFALVANPQLGMVRDWDIFALPVTVASLWIASIAARAPSMRAPGGRWIAGAVVATSLLHAFFWIDANHAPGPSRERIRRVASQASFFGPQSLGEVWRYVGSADAAAGALERASASYRTAIKADSDDRMSYRMLAGIEISRAEAQGKGVDEGLASYHALLAVGTARPAYAFYGGAIAALTSKREDLAIREAKEMIALEPEHPELLGLWGDLLRRAGRMDEARASYEAALSRDPSQPRARIGLACLAGAAGDAATCEAQAREALRRTPWSPQAQQFARLVAQTKGGISPDSFRRYLFIQ